MKIMFGAIVLLWCLFSASVLVTDYAARFFSNVRRYHIGRWESEQLWRTAVRNRAVKWMKHTPTVRKTDNYRYLLLDVLHGEYRNATIQSWQLAGLVLGLQEFGGNNISTLFEKWKKTILTGGGEWKIPVQKVDFALLAYALLKTTDNPQEIKKAMQEMMSVLKKNQCKDGMISYSQGTESAFRYVDTLGMVCPFLAAYGVRYEEKEAVWLAYQQLKQFREFGLLDKSALPCHAYHVVLRKPTGIYGWGRGTAWYFLGLLNTWREMSEGTAEKEDIKQWIYEAAEDYMQYQSQDGGFCTILQGGGQYDSSVTAAMAYFYKWCWKIWNKEVYLRTSERCQQKLKSVTMRDGAVDLCQGDTHGLGTFSQVYDVMPFAQGLLLQAMSE